MYLSTPFSRFIALDPETASKAGAPVTSVAAGYWVPERGDEIKP
jgi:hypothetical protein